MNAPAGSPTAVPANAGGGPALVLIGPPGAGKSTVGTEIATRWGMAFTDTDVVLAEQAGQSIGELFIEVGEERFRDLEHQVVADALTRPGVLALGSGAVARAVAELERFRAAGGAVVFLDVSLAAGMPRVGLNAPRSVTLGSPRAQFSSMAAQRRPLYAAHASLTVDTSTLTPGEVVDQVLDGLKLE